MTSQSITSATSELLIAELTAKIDQLPLASVISDDPLDIEYLQTTIGYYFPARSFATEYHTDFTTMSTQAQQFQSEVVVARITLDGFFDFLKQVDRRNVHVIALVDNVPEELVTARFLELQYVVKTDVSVSASVHYLFSDEKSVG